MNKLASLCVMITFFLVACRAGQAALVDMAAPAVETVEEEATAASALAEPGDESSAVLAAESVEADDASAGEGLASTAVPDSSTAIPVAALRSATYSGIYEEPVTLTDGLYEGEPFTAGDPSRPTVQYADGAELRGDLDGDDLDDAVVFLLESTGGTGIITYIAAQLNDNGEARDAGAVRMDEVQVKSAAIAEGRVELEIITMGPGDGDCCPTHKAQKIYGLQNGRLVEIPTDDGPLQQLSAADLEGSGWALLELHEVQPLAGSEVTLSFADGQIGGSGGCNRYDGHFSLGEDNPLTLALELLPATMQACSRPIEIQETAFFAALDNVTMWDYRFGRLALHYQDEQTGMPARLLFAPGSSLAPALDPAGNENSTEKNEMTQADQIGYVAALEAIYGPRSQEGFGSAIFAAQMAPEDSLEDLAQHYYQEFVGELWQRWGEEAWMAPWQEVYARPNGAEGDIVAELRAIEDPSVANSVPMILDVIENAEAARQALAKAFDGPEMQDVRGFNIGDGEAMSGLIVAGRRAGGEAVFLVFLYD